MQFAPSVYEHAARVINRSPWEVSRSEDLLAQGNVEAFRLYHHDPIVVGIDIYNLEAEAYGATVDHPAANGIPAITKHLCSSAQDILKLRHFNPKTDGRIPMTLRAGKRIARECPEANVKIPVGGPFSVATNLVGFDDLLCEVVIDPNTVSKALHHIVAGQVKLCLEIIDNGLDVAFFESAAAPPLMSPDNFEKVELPALNSMIQQVTAVVGHPVSCVIGGDTLWILDAMLSTGTGYLCCPAETDQKAFMQKMKAHPEVMVRVNIDPRPVSCGNWHEIRKEIDRIFEIIGERENSCIGTGCLPYETNPQIVLKVAEYIRSHK
jgi:uroporphyrinogen-III decarboxylase